MFRINGKFKLYCLHKCSVCQDIFLDWKLSVYLKSVGIAIKNLGTNYYITSKKYAPIFGDSVLLSQYNGRF